MKINAADDGMLGEADDMGVTIFYRHPQRPDEAGMSRVDEAYAAALKEQLVERGFQVVKIVPAPTRAMPVSD
jgi:hypothetical protein